MQGRIAQSAFVRERGGQYILIWQS